MGIKKNQPRTLTLEQAQRLAALGIYDGDYSYYTDSMLGICEEASYDFQFLCPTINEFIDWLEEKEKVCMYAEPIYNDAVLVGWSVSICPETEFEAIVKQNKYDAYSEAIDKVLDILEEHYFKSDLIGQGCSFEPPFECHTPNGCPNKTYIWDKNMKCMLEVRGGQHLQQTHPCSIVKDVKDMQQKIGDTICQILNKHYNDSNC